MSIRLPSTLAFLLVAAALCAEAQPTSRRTPRRPAPARASAPAPRPEAPQAPVLAAIAAAEQALAQGELQVAESRYRSALQEGWLLIGSLDAAEGRLAEAQEAFARAAASAVETRRALESLALVHLQRGNAAEAARVLGRVVAAHRQDPRARGLLARALVALGQPEQAVQELEEARGLAPHDLELAYLLAGGYLRLGKPEAAERLFAQIVRERPIPQTHVLIGRTYRDHGDYDRARAALEAALRLDPKVRRAHYYLGMVAVLDQGAARLEDAIRAFRQELKLAPGDPATSLALGMALVEAQRPDEALPPLETAAGAQPPLANAFHYLGRARIALGRHAEAVPPLRRALELARRESQLGGIHYLLGVALREAGQGEEAARHFSEAERYSAERAENSRERLARYLAGEGAESDAAVAAAPSIEASAFAELAPAGRDSVRAAVRTALARAYFNLGILHVQAERFARAAELFESAAEVDAAFPQVQYSLGVAHFNAGGFAGAAGPLARALEAAPGDAGLRRMLALAWLNTEAYDKAVELLREDPERQRDASLQYAYGLALVRSGRAAEAESLFAALLAQHGDSPELSVVLGQAHAQQGNYEAAIEALSRAVRQKPDVADAQASLGVIYLKQGRLAEAEAALRAAVRTQPADVASQHHLAAVLELSGRPGEALPLLRAALRAKPEFADARYLLGKILLADGAAAEASEHLEAAARLAPDEANIRYQLAQAYQKLGRAAEAEREFEAFRAIKDRRRGVSP